MYQNTFYLIAFCILFVMFYEQHPSGEQLCSRLKKEVFDKKLVFVRNYERLEKKCQTQKS